MWTNIRVLGGAYGSILAVNDKIGLALVTYRDPHIKNTNKVYDNLKNYLNNLNCSKSEIEKYIIGTLSTFDRPKSNYLDFIFNISNYYNKRSNNDAVLQRNEIINTNLKNLKTVISKILKDYRKSGYTVFSNSKKIK